MRSLLLFVGLIMLALSPCLAQQPVVSTPAKLAPPVVETKTLLGKIKTVSLGDAANGVKSEIVVVDESNKESVLLVKSTTTIYDADWKATTLDKVKPEDKVKVTYLISKEGVQEATSIRVKK